MDSMEQEKRQAMAEFRRARRRASVSVVLLALLVGLLVSLSSWDQDLSLLLTRLPDCFWVDRRKAMFLLCNLILAVVAMDSGLLASFTPEEERCGEFSVREKSHRSREEVRRLSAVGSRWPLPVPAAEEGGKLAVAAAAAAAVEEEEQEQEQQEQQYQQLRKEQEQQQQQQQQEQEQEEEGVDEDGCPDMDELNKKFEDFIEKVKMERKLEALQLVRV